MSLLNATMICLLSMALNYLFSKKAQNGKGHCFSASVWMRVQETDVLGKAKVQGKMPVCIPAGTMLWVPTTGPQSKAATPLMLLLKPLGPGEGFFFRLSIS